MEHIDLITVETTENDIIKHRKSDLINEIKIIYDERVVDDHSINIKEENTSKRTKLNAQQKLQENITTDFEQVFIDDIKTEIDTADDPIGDASFNIKIEESEYEAVCKSQGAEEILTVTPDLTFVNVTQMEPELDTFSHKTEKEKQQNKISQLHECSICNKKVKKIRSHMSTHSEKSHECSVCQRRFNQSTNLTRHMRIHTGNKPHECDICKKTFRQSCHLTAHMSMHTVEKPFECNICMRRFSTKQFHTRHLRMHVLGKPHICNICEKAFSWPCNLKAHMILHTDIKSHECSVCQKKFSHSYILKRHMRIHTGEKPFECDICKRKFNRSCHLSAHISRHAGKKSA